MPRICEFCGKKTQTGFAVSHSHRRTKRKVLPNLQYKKLLIEGKYKRVRICTRCLKKLTKV